MTWQIESATMRPQRSMFLHPHTSDCFVPSKCNCHMISMWIVSTKMAFALPHMCSSGGDGRLCRANPVSQDFTPKIGAKSLESAQLSL